VLSFSIAFTMDNNNPLLESDGSSSSAAPTRTGAPHGSPFTPASAASPSVACLQTSCASVVLDIAEPNNYSQWRCFVDGIINNSGFIGGHLASSPTTAERRDEDWLAVDQGIVEWLYEDLSTDVCDIIRVPNATAFTV
jgi:hypothetical protein